MKLFDHFTRAGDLFFRWRSYLGNCLVALGLSFFSRTWFLPVIVSLASLVYYERIAAREEEFLEARFGQEFRDWAARVPAVIPQVRQYVPPALPFRWKKAARREFYGLFVITSGFFLLDVIEDFWVTGHVNLDPLWASAFVLSGCLFFVMRTLKKLLSDREPEFAPDPPR